MKPLTKSLFIERAKEKHGDKFGYNDVEWVNTYRPVSIVCPHHGTYKQIPKLHMNGFGCPACSGKKPFTTESFIAKAVETHGTTYDYSDVVYESNKALVTIKCSIHGEFKQQAKAHLNGAGCRKCANEKRRLSSAQFIDKAQEVHGRKYLYDGVVYTDSKDKIDITCRQHGVFSQQPNSHLSGYGCPECAKLISHQEEDVLNYVGTLTSDIVRNARDIIPPYELDIYIPSRKLAIEYCGVFWHSSSQKPAGYHRMKYDRCHTKGIKLIQLFENEWLSKRGIVEQRLRSMLGKNTVRFNARDTEVRVISVEEARAFLDHNHIQGYTGCKIRLGAFVANDLVSVMTFGSARYNKAEWELIRFASKENTTIVGVASKLFETFKREYAPVSMISYCDLRWGDGKVYETMGFQRTHISRPNYFYFKNGHTLFSRVGFQKHKLKSKLEIFDAALSEQENMKLNGYHHIYDCGNAVYVWCRP